MSPALINISLTKKSTDTKKKKKTGIFSGTGLRLVRRGLGVRQLDLLRGGHAVGHRREGRASPPRRARGDVHDGPQDPLAEGAREEEVPDVVGPRDGVRSPEAEVFTI